MKDKVLKNKHVLYLVLFTLLFIPRLYRFGSVPVSLYWDEIAMLVDVKALTTTYKDMHGNPIYQAIFPSYGDFKLPMYLWLSTLVVAFAGVSATSIRVVSLCAALINMYNSYHILYYFLHEKEKKYAWFAPLVILLTPWSFLFSRTGFEAQLGQALVSLSVFLLLRTYTFRSYIAAVFVGAASVYAYFSVRFVWPLLFILSLGFEAIKEQEPTPKSTITIRILIGIFLFGLLIQPLQHSKFAEISNQVRFSTESILDQTQSVLESNRARELSGNTVLDRLLFHRNYFTGKRLLSNYSQFLSFDFLFSTGDQNLRHGTAQHGVLLLSMMPFLFIGMWDSLKKQKHFFVFNGLWIVAALLPAAIPVEIPHALRSLNALVPFSLFVAYGLVAFNRYVETLFNTKKVLIAVVAFMVIEYSSFVYHYFVVYPQVSALAWQDNYQMLADALVDQIDEVDTLYVQGFDDRFYLWVMANSYFSGKEFDSWDEDNFRFSQIENIIFNSSIVEHMQQGNSKTIVAGKYEDITDLLDQIPKSKSYELEVIPNSFGDNQFLLVKFK